MKLLMVLSVIGLVLVFSDSGLDGGENELEIIILAFAACTFGLLFLRSKIL